MSAGRSSGARIDMIGQRHPALPVMLADKPVLPPQAQPDKTGIADDDALQPQQFVKINRLPPASPMARPQRWMRSCGARSPSIA